jgi:hypothetical protein
MAGSITVQEVAAHTDVLAVRCSRCERLSSCRFSILFAGALKLVWEGACPFTGNEDRSSAGSPAVTMIGHRARHGIGDAHAGTQPAPECADVAAPAFPEQFLFPRSPFLRIYCIRD